MALAALLAIVTAPAASKATVGDLLVRIVHLRGPAAADGASAAASLKAAGVPLPEVDLAAPLTEGVAAHIVTALGMKLTTSRPDAPLSQSQMEALVAILAPEIARPPGSRTAETAAPPPPPGDNAKRKGQQKAPRTEPD